MYLNPLVLQNIQITAAKLEISETTKICDIIIPGSLSAGGAICYLSAIK